MFFDLRLNYGWVNNREAGDLRRYRVHYDVIVMPLGRLLVKMINNGNFKIEWDCFVFSRNLVFNMTWFPLLSTALLYTYRLYMSMHGQRDKSKFVFLILKWSLWPEKLHAKKYTILYMNIVRIICNQNVTNVYLCWICQTAPILNLQQGETVGVSQSYEIFCNNRNILDHIWLHVTPFTNMV